MSKGPFVLLLLAASVGGLAHAATFTGTVFEDANYGGGAGRSLAASAGTPLSGVRVELYRASNNNYLGTATTNGSGVYTISSSGINAGQAVIVRVVNGTVRSARAGGSGCSTCVPVQTFRTAGSGGGVVAVTNRVGGENPALSDGPSNTSSFTAIDDNGGIAQSVTTVSPATTTSTVTGIDFGFNFDTIVNTRDAANCGATNASYPCQGSLRQFVINSNALGGEGSLAQAGNGQIDGSPAPLPGGFESS
ncbi:MAG: hypothetical protein K0Q92_3894, partial [Steroidobacteraceae bacterium]|nr:hypothetical protein [Steroidobacteraceae bacterium]